MKKKTKIEFINDTEEDREYIRMLSIDCMEDELLNDSIFGDDEKLAKLKKINSLEMWKKNLLFAYIKYGSFKKLEKVLNVKASTIATTVNEIRKELTDGIS